MKERLTFVCFSSQPWEDGMWTNKQHVMSRIAKDHRVVFVNFGAQSPFKFLARTRGASASPFDGRDIWRKPSVLRISDSLEVLDVFVPNWLNFLPRGHRLRTAIDFDHRVRVVGRWLASQGIDDAVLWVYHPGYGDTVARIPHRLVVYDCVDEYTAFPEFHSAKAWIAARERALCSIAGVVSCTASALFDAKRDLAPGRTHLVHNVGDGHHFSKALSAETVVPSELAHLPRPIIGFVGAVSDYKLNTEWLVHLASARPHYSVVLIGPEGVGDPGTDVAALKALRNVVFLGHRPYETLPSYIKGFDVAVIPYRINDYTRSVFPLKFFELLATGKPVVISRLPALEEFWSAVQVADDAETFVQACDSAPQRDDASARARRLQLAQLNSWDSRVGKLLGLVGAALAGR